MSTVAPPIGQWTALTRPEPNVLFAAPWRSWHFERSMRLSTPTTWTPAASISTAAFKEEGIETLMLMNLDCLFPGWHLRLGERALNGWAGADIMATDPNGAAHIFEVKYGASEANVVDQALSYAVDLLADRRPAWFDEQDAETKRIFLASRIAGIWLNQRTDKWRRASDCPFLEGFRKVLAENMSNQAYSLDALNRDAEDAIRAMQPSEHRKNIDEGLETTDLHIHLVVPAPEKIKTEQLHALARLKFRGLRVSIWQIACQRIPSQDGQFAGQFAIREIWLRPLDTQLGGARGGGIVPSFHLAPLLNEVTMRLGQRLPFRWHYQRTNAARVGDDWFRHQFPALAVAEQVEGTAKVLSVRMNFVIPERWRTMPQAQLALAARESFISEWLSLCAPPSPNNQVCRRALDELQRKTIKWETVDPTTGKVLSGYRSSGLVTGQVAWTSDDNDASASILRALLHQALHLSLKHPQAFPREIET